MKDHIERMIRVDQAGEFGATRIYAGQLAVMGDRGPHSGEIAAMARQEDVHHDAFNALMAERGVRPTALIGPKPAMACTAAVETEIDLHYSKQLDTLKDADEEPELQAMIEQFREEEREHHDAAIAAGAEETPAYPLLSAAIRLGCRAAIRLSERV